MSVISESHFTSTDLLTPERLSTDPEGAFKVVPAWVELYRLVSHGSDTPPAFVVTFGRTHKMTLSLSVVTFALICELTRLPGVSLATDTNGKTPPRFYPRLTFSGFGEDLTSLSRLIHGAGPYEQMKMGSIRTDFRPENLHTVPASIWVYPYRTS